MEYKERLKVYDRLLCCNDFSIHGLGRKGWIYSAELGNYMGRRHDNVLRAIKAYNKRSERLGVKCICKDRYGKYRLFENQVRAILKRYPELLKQFNDEMKAREDYYQNRADQWVEGIKDLFKSIGRG